MLSVRQVPVEAVWILVGRALLPCGLCDPCGGDDLPAFPAAAIQHHLADFGEVPGENVETSCRLHRAVAHGRPAVFGDVHRLEEVLGRETLERLAGDAS